MHKAFLLGLASAALLASCAATSQPQATPLASKNAGPPNPDPGACYAKQTSPAVIETVTVHVVVRAATYDDNGGLLSPAAYRTETVQKIVTARVDTWFKTPCTAQMSGDFTASLQRALKVRGLYRGRITGKMDTRTKRAVRRLQKAGGLDSGTLSLSTARKLGLVAYPIDS